MIPFFVPCKITFDRGIDEAEPLSPVMVVRKNLGINRVVGFLAPPRPTARSHSHSKP